MSVWLDDQRQAPVTPSASPDIVYYEQQLPQRVVYIDKPIVREKIVTVTQDVLVPFEKIVEVPVDKVVYRDKIVTHTTEVPVDRVVEVPVDRVVTQEVVKYVDKFIDREVIRTVQQPNVVFRDKIVEVPVERVVEKEVIRYVDRFFDREVIKTVPVDRIVEKEVPVYIDKVVEKLVMKEVPVEVPKLVVRDKIKQVFVDRLVDKLPEKCGKCATFIDAEGTGACSVCPLREQLARPQAPVIVPREKECSLDVVAGYTWSASDALVVQVVHASLDGWQQPDGVTLYATIDGSDPSKQHHAFSGPPPLVFCLSHSCCIKAIAVNSKGGQSSISEQKFSHIQQVGIGLLLQTIQGCRGIYILNVVPGGAVWTEGNIQSGDEILEIDGQHLDGMSLGDVTKLIVGYVASSVQLKILREDRSEDGSHLDGVGFQFVATIIRNSPNTDAIRSPPIPVAELQGYTRVGD